MVITAEQQRNYAALPEYRTKFCVSLLPGDFDWVDYLPEHGKILARGLYIPDDVYPFKPELSFKHVALNAAVSSRTEDELIAQSKLNSWLKNNDIPNNDNFQRKEYEQEEVYQIIQQRTMLLARHNPVF